MDKPSSFLIQPQENSEVGSTVFASFPMGKEPSCQYRKCKRHGFDPGLGRHPGGGNGNLLQYSCLENLMDRGAWQATVHGVAKSRTRLMWLSTSSSSHCAKAPTALGHGVLPKIYLIAFHSSPASLLHHKTVLLGSSYKLSTPQSFLSGSAFDETQTNTTSKSLYVLL